MMRMIELCVIILCIQYNTETVYTSKNVGSMSNLHNGTKRETMSETHNGTKRETVSEANRKKAMEVFYMALDASIGLPLAALENEIPLFSTFYSFFKEMYTEFTKNKQTLWQQIKTQVEQSIDNSNADIDLDDLDGDLRELERRIKEGNFTQGDYEFATSRLMERVFPHKREAVAWSDDLPVRTLYYVALIVQVYYIRIDQGLAEKCNLGKRLVEIRQNVIDGMKEMIRKRYRQIKDKTSADGKYDYVNFTISGHNDFKASVMPEGKETELVKTSTRRHGGNNMYSSYKVYSWKYQIKYIEKEAINYLMSEVVDKINNFFKQDLCFEGCECPAPITSTEIALEWPTECLGNPDNEELRCEHPCGKFGETYNWCFKPYEQKSLLTKDWTECKPINIRCCIKFSYDRPNRCPVDKKKKKTRKISKLQSKQNKEGGKEGERLLV